MTLVVILQILHPLAEFRTGCIFSHPASCIVRHSGSSAFALPGVKQRHCHRGQVLVAADRVPFSGQRPSVPEARRPRRKRAATGLSL